MRRRIAQLLRRLASMLDSQTQQSSQSTFQIVGGGDRIDISGRKSIARKSVIEYF